MSSSKKQIQHEQKRSFIAPEGDISIEVEEKDGQLFVQVMVDIPSVRTLTIVSEKGVEQIFEVNPKEYPTEITVQDAQFPEKKEASHNAHMRAII